MELLGKLGIDLPLLAAQIVNFGVLLWLLRRFLYAPVMARIEEDEGKMMRGEKLRQELDVREADLTRRGEEERRKIREESEKALAEADAAAALVAAGAAKQSRRMIGEAVEAAHREAEEEKAAAVAGMEKRLEGELGTRFAARLTEGMTVDLKRDLQDAFRERLLRQVREMPIADGRRAVERAKAALAAEERHGIGSGARARETRLRALVEKELGPLRIEYALEPGKALLDEVGSIVAGRIGLPFPPRIETGKSDALLAGYRLEVFGRLVEENLARELKYGFEGK